MSAIPPRVSASASTIDEGDSGTLFTDAQSGLARSAVLLSLGNIASRILGLVREMVISRTFALAEVSAFTVASQVPTLLYDFLIGGMLSAALVPVLSDYAERGRKEFSQLVSLLLTIFALLLALLTVALYVLAPQATDLMTTFEKTDPALLLVTTRLIRQITPAIWLFSMAGLLTAVLYSLRRFTWPALATALYNLGIVVAAPVLAPRIGITSLVVGILLGAASQFLVIGWDLRRIGLTLRATIQWRHPALKRIFYLYLPIAAGLAVALFQVGLDRRLASGTEEKSIAWMRFATTLQQLPLGLISVAISLAALPRLSQYFASGDDLAYRQTLGRGLRMVLLLILPATVLLGLLGEPIARLIFGSSKLTPYDMAQVVASLQIYLIGMIFAAIDFPLNYAFYARHNTLLPALVGVGSVLCYIVVAFALLPSLSYLGLVWADTAKQASHAITMLILLYWQIGRLGANVGKGLVQMGIAATFMAVVILALLFFMGGGHLGGGWPENQWSSVLQLAVMGGGGMVAYLATLHAFQLPEIMLIRSYLRTRLGM
ncbi:MAG TPA: murein biosynthesis integral membrane protein MurJ [Caldilineaceae bacterium]|mgnify:CR=1 FL=1|nr:murein biosynthesis integral membrane protein MurJ [Caldilineaceae bacterium]